MEMVNVSVIIPAFNSKKTIKNTVRSLLSQAYKNIEIIVVDSGTDGTDLSEFEKVTHIRTRPDVNAPTARNIGFSKSSGGIVFFTDSDCIVERRCIEELVKSHSEHDVVGGSLPFYSRNFFSRAADLLWYNFQPSVREQFVEFTPSANLSFKRHVFKELKGFREDILAGEDRDICIRAKILGHKVLFNPRAMVYHDNPRTSFLKFIIRNMFYGSEGMKTKIMMKRHMKIGKAISSNAYIMLLLSMPLALAATFKISYNVLKIDIKNFIYIPLILIGRLAWSLGLVRGCKICARRGNACLTKNL